MLLHLVRDVHVQGIHTTLLAEEGSTASLTWDVEVLPHVSTTESTMLHLLELRQLHLVQHAGAELVG